MIAQYKKTRENQIKRRRSRKPNVKKLLERIDMNRERLNSKVEVV